MTTDTPGRPTPTGEVQFRDHNSLLGTVPLTIVDGQARAVFTTVLGRGPHQIVAVYSGGPKHDPSFSGSLAY